MSAKFGKILCPVQLEQNSAAALRFALELVPPDGRLFVLHVVPAGPACDRLHRSTVTLAHRSLENFVQEQPQGNVKPELLVRSGDAAEIIVQVANELGVDVVVMATHGHKAFARLLLGSVAERVMRQARTPVLTLRPEIAVQPKSA
jgi:universal stress protein A